MTNLGSELLHKDEVAFHEVYDEWDNTITVSASWRQWTGFEIREADEDMDFKAMEEIALAELNERVQEAFTVLKNRFGENPT